MTQVVDRCGVRDEIVHHLEEDCPDRCTIKGRDADHPPSEHFCAVCCKLGVDHFESDCPKRCSIKGCLNLHLVDEHFCGVCNKVGVDHCESACPDRCTPSC